MVVGRTPRRLTATLLDCPAMRRRLRSASFPLHRHSLPQLAIDGVLVGLAYVLAFQLRFDRGLKGSYQTLFERTLAFAPGFHAVAIDLPQSWLDESPLSAAALEDEADHWKTVGMKLQVSGLSDKKVSVLKQVR